MYIRYIFFILLILTSHALADKLIISTTEWEPYIIMENGKATGIFSEIVTEACKSLEIEPEIQILPWARAIKYVKIGRADAILGPKKTEKRLEFLYFPSEPLYIEKLVIMALKGSNIKACGLDDLKDQYVGVVRNYSYGYEFDNYKGLKKIVYDDDLQLMRMLDKGRVKIIAGEVGNLSFIAKKTDMKVALETVFFLTEDPDYIAFSKKALGEKGKIMADKFSEILRQLKKEGFVEKVESKYF